MACYDVTTDAYNCGTCGQACPAGQTCSGGTCTSEDSAFRMLGRDGAHSGYLPGETGSPPPSTVPAWSYAVGGSPSPAVVEGGRVYVTSNASFGSNSAFAFEASSGALLGDIWVHSPSETPITSWRAGAVRSRQLAVSGDGKRLAVLTDDPTLQFLAVP